MPARSMRSIKDQLLHEVQDTQESKKRLNTDVDASLYRRMKSQALREERTISDITRQLWTEYLSKNSIE